MSYRYPTHWTALLLTLVMVMQTSAIMADVLTAADGQEKHDAHAETDHAFTIEHHLHDWPSHSDDPGNAEETHQHCHANHCHGSHLPLSAQLFELNLPVPTQQIPAYLSLTLPEHTDTILRPPIT